MLRGYCQSHSNMSCYLFTSPLCCLFKISFVFTDSQILTSNVNVFFSLTCLLLVLSNSKPNFDSDQPKTKNVPCLSSALQMSLQAFSVLFHFPRFGCFICSFTDVYFMAYAPPPFRFPEIQRGDTGSPSTEGPTLGT